VLNGQVLMLDRGSGLFAFDSKRAPLEPGQDAWWKTEPLRPGSPTSGTPYLFVAEDRSAVYEISSPEKSKTMTVRRCRAGGEREGSRVLDKEMAVNLPDFLAGRPALSSQYLVLLLADGSMQRLALSFDSDILAGGPDWRAARADDGARGYVVPISADE